jgi:hypothetical protein
VLGLALALALAGCGQSEETLDSFAKRWHASVNDRDGQKLYDQLDAASQSGMRRDLEVLRGLDAASQQSVLNQLGGVRVQSLRDLEPAEYFALLWHRATDGQRPTMRVEAHDDHSAYMVLTLGRKDQRVRLWREAGRWVWQLPPQPFGVTTGDHAVEP